MKSVELNAAGHRYIMELVFQLCKNRLPEPFSMEDFFRAFREYEFIPLSFQGAPCGAVLRKGSELHVAISPAARGRSGFKHALAVLDETIKVHGKAISSVMNDYAVGHRVALRLGFTRVGTDAGVTYYEKRQPE